MLTNLPSQQSISSAIPGPKSAMCSCFDEAGSGGIEWEAGHMRARSLANAGGTPVA
ncbi:MAG: hypothetical protein IV100_32035 [Myxococcales bacterium]|nr:hypothetical protein [Myxococcales bacterium]